MSGAPTAWLESLDAAGDGVRVEFRWAGDRYQHLILQVRNGKAEPALTSEDEDDAAPSFVDLHRHNEDILVTGANAQGHWSLSVQSQAAGLVFDIACRSKFAHLAKASIYSRSESAGSVAVESVDIDGVASSSVSHADNGQLRIAPKQKTSTSSPQTVRWCYRAAMRRK